MKTRIHCILGAIILLFTLSPVAVVAQGTAFTYQGRLATNGVPVNGSYDFQFRLYSAPTGGSQIPVVPASLDVAVSNGLFTTSMDFGNNVFNGTIYWLEIALVPHNGLGFTTLSPRQELLPVPGAIFANNASNLLGTLPATQLSGTISAGQLNGTAGAATNFTGNLSGDVTGTQSATVVALVGGQSAANVAAGAGAANAATSANTAGTIVKRDGSGNFFAGSASLAGSLTLPVAGPTIFSGANLLLHGDAVGDFFVGPLAGNLTLSAFADTGVGAQALSSNATGEDNTAAGYQALFSNTSANDNTAIGYQALYFNKIGNNNTAIGSQALYANTNGGNNTAIGAGALDSNTSGGGNTAVGIGAMDANTNGTFNTALGDSALANNTHGSGNLALGFSAGINITTGGNNIDIGHPGVAGDTNIIRLGTSQTNTFVAGIFGATAASGVEVFVNNSGQLGTLTSSEQFKQNIRSMGDASDVLLALRPVAFQYKREIDPQSLPQFGLIAEEVDKVDPDLVARDDKNRIYTVRYQAVSAMLLNEFLKQHQKVEEQNQTIRNLKEKVEDGRQNSEDRIQKLETENAELKQRLEKLEELANSKYLETHGRDARAAIITN
jgi:hypothetical protein